MKAGRSSVRVAPWLASFWLAGAGLSAGGLAVFDAQAVERAAPAGKGAKKSQLKGAPMETEADALQREKADGLDGQDVFQVLLGEIALQRGDRELAAEAYADAAQRTGDDALFGRAVQMAVSAQQYERALDLSQRWVAASPDSAPARHALVTVLSGVGRHAELVPHMERLLALDVEARPRNLLHFPRLIAAMDVELALVAGRQLVAPYQDLPEAHLTLANLARAAGQKSLALTEVREAARLRAGWPVAAYLEAQLQDSPQDAIAVWSRFLATTKDHEPAYVQRARLYIGEKMYVEARADFESALALNPASVDAIYALAILSLQLNDRPAAEKYFRSLDGREFGGKDLVDYQLGLLALDRDDSPAAQRYFASVGKGEYFVRARAHLALILSRDGKSSEAKKLLSETSASTGDDLVRLAIVEAQLLREANQFEAALAVLETALKAQPNEPDLLYDRAMLAERLKKTDLVETTLARLIELQPNHPHAYNALGYSWAERNVRLDEARQLIARALELAPQDPFILDSMGWVMFRLGKPEVALTHLQDAYRQRPDPEIAAHIGEVLWSLGRRDEARKIWTEARQKFPSNEALGAVIEKFRP